MAQSSRSDVPMGKAYCNFTIPADFARHDALERESRGLALTIAKQNDRVASVCNALQKTYKDIEDYKLYVNNRLKNIEDVSTTKFNAIDSALNATIAGNCDNLDEKVKMIEAQIVSMIQNFTSERMWPSSQHHVQQPKGNRRANYGIGAPQRQQPNPLDRGGA